MNGNDEFFTIYLNQITNQDIIEAHNKLGNILINCCKNNMEFKFLFDLMSLIIQRQTIEFTLKNPIFQKRYSKCYENAKAVIEKIDQIFRNVGFTNNEIATLERPENPEVLYPILKKALADKAVYELILNPLEYNAFHSTILLALKHSEFVSNLKTQRFYNNTMQTLAYFSEILKELGLNQIEILLINNTEFVTDLNEEEKKMVEGEKDE